MSENYHVILVPRTVPTGNYCFGYNRTDDKDGYPRVCEYFDNEGGYPDCTLNIGLLKYDEHDFVKKPKECILLEQMWASQYNEDYIKALERLKLLFEKKGKNR